MRYTFTNRYIMTGEDGTVVQDREWNPDAKSDDGVQCPVCKSLFPEHWKDEECVCDEPGREQPKRIAVQIVDCFNCSEYILAEEFIDHLSDCMSY